MTRYTVQCGYAAYYANTVTVEADSLEAALEAAIEQANGDACWKALDHCGDTFVDAAAEGVDANPWDGFRSAIPDHFTEQGEPPTVTVMMENGIVRDVMVEGGKVRVRVRDYDTDGADPTHCDIRRDADGDAYVLSDWTNELPPRAADPEHESARPFPRL